MERSNPLMTIGQVARTAGVATTTLRYYEREGILRATIRNGAGYRLYDARAVERLRFIRAAQGIGFTLDDIRALGQLGAEAPCQEVQTLIERRLAAVDAKLADLKRIQATLAEALERCRKSDRTCAVVADLKKSYNQRSTT